MPWGLYGIQVGPELGNEQWRGYELPMLSQVKAYGFRLVPPLVPYPSTWQNAGFWQVCVVTATAAQLSPVQVLSTFDNPAIPCLTMIGTEQVVETSEVTVGLFVLLSINRWITSRDVEIWIQT